MKVFEVIEDATNEGFIDWFKKANNPQDMQQDVVPMVKQLLDRGMSDQEVVATVEQELGVRPRYIQQAIQMIRAGLAEGRLKSKSYRKSYKAAKASGRRSKKSLRDSVNENSQANAMLAKVDTVLQGTGFARQGFKIVKAAQQGSVRGSINDEALTMIKNMLAKAQSMGATDAPTPTATQQPSQVSNTEFTETATAGGTSAGAIATVSNPSVTRNAKKPKKRKGVAPNAQDSNANLMTGQVIKR